MEIPFTHYLHGSKEDAWELREELEAKFGFEFSDEAFDNFRYAFYEVTLECVLNTDTGIVDIVSAK